MARCPRAVISWAANRARRAYSPAVKIASGATTSMRWCGTRARCSGEGLAVPISNSRYTATESQLITSPPKRTASAIASEDLPLAVGPAITTSGACEGALIVIQRAFSAHSADIHRTFNARQEFDEGKKENS